ncbi:MAG: GLPGLI family protein [Muribaculaceae bacterium]|nr:GLPGLI family protein [Muribaculaceae bacterium]
MRHIILIFLTLTAFIAGAVNPSNRYIKEPEEAILEVVYSRKSIRDTTTQLFVTDETILRIGKNKSMYCGIRKLWADSLMNVDYSSYRAVSSAAFRNKDYFPAGHYWSYVYKDFNKKKCKEYEYFSLEFEKYEEDLEIPAWTVTDSTKRILGYECIKVTSDFRGRQWTAWFTPEIPVSDGPWKLHGLPGLILEAYDNQHDYEFDVISIRDAGIGLIGYMEYDDYIEVSREKHMNNWWKSKHESMGALLKAAYGTNVPSKSVSTKIVPKYDREEIDYDHSLK